jgi:hypothetical protein
MSALTQSFLFRAVTAFFKHDLKLKRAEDGVRIVLQERKFEPKPPTRQQKVQQRENQELELIRKQLAELLDTLPGTRDTMRHLVFVEQALAKKGLRALHKLPLEVLEHALSQLEGLVTNWAPVGLANLRSKMAVSILDREHSDPEAENDAYRTAAVLDSKAPPTPAVAAVEKAAEQAAEAAAVQSDEAALAAAYAMLGNLVPKSEAPAVEVETQAELGSRSAKSMHRRRGDRPTFADTAPPDSLKLRELQIS